MGSRICAASWDPCSYSYWVCWLRGVRHVNREPEEHQLQFQLQFRLHNPVSGPSGAHGRSALQRAETESRPRQGASRQRPRVAAPHAQEMSPRSRTAMSMFAHHVMRPATTVQPRGHCLGCKKPSTSTRGMKDEHKYKFFHVILVLCGVK